MTRIKIGALCWNQYTEWPALLQAGIRAEELGFDTLWTWDHLYPIVGDSNGPNYEGWLDDHGLGTGDEADPGRPDGRGEHVPRADAHGEARDDPRPHQRRPGDPGDRRRVVRGGARGVRAGLRVRVPRAAALAWRGGAGDARDARRDRAVGEGRPLPGEAGAQPARAGPGAPPDLHRRGRRAGDPQARREVRGHEQRRRRDRERPAQGGDPAPPLRDGGPGPVGDRAHDGDRHRVHPR